MWPGPTKGYNLSNCMTLRDNNITIVYTSYFLEFYSPFYNGDVILHANITAK